MISFLVAMDKNHVIGYQNDLPWSLPLDLQYFKEVTMGHTMVMGRKTFDAIGRVLPGRKSVVLTRQKNIDLPEEVDIIHDVKDIIKMHEESPDEELFIIGGGELFKLLLPEADRLYITLIDYEFKGDTYFPKFDESEWEVVKKEKGIKNEENPYDYYFMLYERKS